MREPVIAPMLADTTEDRHAAQFVVAPNRSLSWRGNKIFFVYMAILSFSIAGIFAALGMWVVLPFAGMEMLLLWLALYFSSVRLDKCEVVSVEGGKIRVSVGRYGPERSCEFERNWAQVILDKPRIRGYPTRLLIRSHGREVEIGVCLNDEERSELAEALRRSI